MQNENPNEHCLYTEKRGVAPGTKRELFEKTIRRVERDCRQIERHTEQTDAFPALVFMDFGNLWQFD